MKKNYLDFHNVSVDYLINHTQKISEIFKKNLPKPNKIRALDNINLKINSGERVGLIGKNGAGKSTILKVMANIYKPTEGICNIQGKVSPLFELATGFEMELDGWSNIRIRALLLGMQKKEVDNLIQDIADFSELGEYLNYPVRTYSSGMFIRLAFAVSTAIQPEILLLDEIIGAGDASFAQKAQKRMESFMDNSQILVLTSHATDLLKRFCTRTIWLDKGQIRFDGPTDEAVDAYLEFIRN